MKRSNLMVGLLSVLVVFAVAAAFKAAQTVLIPLMIAWLLSYICGPVVTFLVDKKVPLGLAVFAVLMLVLGVCYLGGIFLIGRVQSFAAEYQTYAERLTIIHNDIMYNLSEKIQVPEGAFADINWAKEIGMRLVVVSGSVASFVGNLIMVLIFLVFMLLGKPYFKYKVAKAFPPGNATQFTGVTASISKQIGQYLSVKVAVSGTTAVLVWVGLTLLGVEFALTWGALAFFLNFIPSIGSIIASVPPILLAVVQFYPSAWMPVLTGIILLTIQMVMGNVIEPKLVGDSLNLSPVVILLSLVFFGWMWGVVGALMSVPIAAAIKIVCENIEGLRPISVLMGSGKICMKDMQAS
jgi:predicted PurR-regulated permease PerM